MVTRGTAASATISSCGHYRYSLAREWNTALPRVLFIGVNPSTADAEVDDHTVRKWRGFSERWGYGSFAVANLFAWRSTDVDELAYVTDPIGPRNDIHLRNLLQGASLVVPCWGRANKVPRNLRGRIASVHGALASDVVCPIRVLGLTSSGDPRHPLTLAYDTSLESWQP